MKLRSILTYCFRDIMRASLIFVGIYVLVILLLAVLSLITEGHTYLNGGYEIAAGITMFVVGICSVREYLRLAIQNGVGRNTTFFAMILSLICACAVLAVLGELISTLGETLTENNDRVSFSSLYALIYSGLYGVMQVGAAPGTVLSHVQSIGLVFVTLAGLYLCGSFLSLLFYRLKKVFKVILAIALPFIICWIIPVALIRVGGAIGAEATISILASPGLMMLCMLAGAVVMAILCWLLIFRAPIKAVK
ncbi:MAG: hypothetical protein IJG63_04670 [Oscillospiraceae bacterium]|nr:hypothetical protein [Oscillospiraceae bacterium]